MRERYVLWSSFNFFFSTDLFLSAFSRYLHRNQNTTRMCVCARVPVPIFENSQSQFIRLTRNFFAYDSSRFISCLIVVESNREFIDLKPSHFASLKTITISILFFFHLKNVIFSHANIQPAGQRIRTTLYIMLYNRATSIHVMMNFGAATEKCGRKLVTLMLQMEWYLLWGG